MPMLDAWYVCNLEISCYMHKSKFGMTDACRCATRAYTKDHITVWAQKECILCTEWYVEWRLYRSYISRERSLGNLYIAVCSLPNLIIVYYMYRIPPVERDIIPIISQRGDSTRVKPSKCQWYEAMHALHGSAVLAQGVYCMCCISPLRGGGISNI